MKLIPDNNDMSRIVGLIVRRMGREVTFRHPLTDLQYAVVQALDTEYESAFVAGGFVNCNANRKVRRKALYKFNSSCTLFIIGKATS